MQVEHSLCNIPIHVAETLRQGESWQQFRPFNFRGCCFWYMQHTKMWLQLLPQKAVSLLFTVLQEPNRKVLLNFCLVKKLNKISRYWESALLRLPKEFASHRQYFAWRNLRLFDYTLHSACALPLPDETFINCYFQSICCLCSSGNRTTELGVSLVLKL